MNWNTQIIGGARKYLGISLSEYVVADFIHHMSGTKSPVVGWCITSKANIGETFDLSRRSVFNIIKTLENKGLIEKSKETGFLRSTQKWFDVVMKGGWEIKSDTTGAKIALDPVQKLHSPGAKIAPYNIIDREKEIETSGVKDFSKESGSKVNLFQKFLLAFQVQQNANLSTAWVKLSDQDKKLIEKHLPEYIKRTAPKGAESPLTWRKTPLNYLKGREWLNPLPVVKDQTLIDPKVLPKERTGGKVVPSNGVRYV